MKKYFVLIMLVFFTISCKSKNYIEVSKTDIKKITIDNSYKVLYCECENNPLTDKLIIQFKNKGFDVIALKGFDEIENIESSNNIVILGYINTSIGDSKNYTYSYLESFTQDIDCGEGCNITRYWNEYKIKTISNPANTANYNVLVYKIDEDTELLLALSDGEKISIKLETKQESGSDENILKEKNEYIIN